MLLKIRKLFCVGIGYDMAAGASVQILSVTATLDMSKYDICGDATDTMSNNSD